MSRVRVLLTNAAIGPLDYRVPDGQAAGPGSIVTAPLGPRLLTGVVWEADHMPSVGEVEDRRLRPLALVHDLPPLAAPLRRLIEWTAHYYLAPPAAVLRMALVSGAMLDAARSITEYRLSGTIPDRMTPARRQAIEALDGRQGSVRELAAAASVSDAVIRGLIATGALDAVESKGHGSIAAPDPDHAPPTLSAAQASAARAMCASVAAQQDDVFMLDGVTGSGKTEVYFEAIAEALRHNRQALVLLPEIAMTQPFLARFEARFGSAPVAWHSDLRQSERKRAWHAIADGSAAVTVGARSALFLPYRDLGLVIVDEAHETSFKQEEGVHYHARDVAIMRGRFERCPVVLASATHAVETRQQAAMGRYRTLALPSRHGGASLPAISAIDLLTTPPERGCWLAPPLIRAMHATLDRGEQALLFLNRRGYAPLTLCRHCGHRFECPNCTAWMVEHRLLGRLQCHHCGHAMPQPQHCPACGESDSLVACGPGVERIAEEVRLRFPDVTTAIVTSDTLWSPARAAQFVERMSAGEIDIVIGTQLVTKGYHFPELTLVGVVDADLGLAGGDLRAAERTFQQIMQVAGRAGRSGKPGTVLLQTHQPAHPVIAALVAGEAEAFYAAETEARRSAGAPPFGRYVAIIVSSTERQQAQSLADLLARNAPRIDGFSVYGPAPAPLAVLRGRHRFRLLVHARRALDVQQAVRDWLAPAPRPGDSRIIVDVDPYSFV